MYYGEIKKCDIANGPGVRVSLFVSGCTHHCKECFNPETWDFKYGKPFTEETIQTILSYMEPEYVKGITLLGGEPLEHSNQKGLLPLVRVIKEKYPNKTIWLYTGSLWEEIQHEEILHYLDVLVDGEFQVDKLDVGLKWKGSSNQRVIDVPSTLCEHRIVLHAE